jgi:hypothetical protein
MDPLNLDELQTELEQLKVARGEEYALSLGETDPLRKRRIMVNLFQNTIMDPVSIQYRIDRQGPAYLNYEMNGQKYTFFEYPSNSDILSLKNFGRMYVMTGSISVRPSMTVGQTGLLGMAFEKNASVYIVLQVQYGIRDPVRGYRTENWVYLAKTGVDLDDIFGSETLGFAGHNRMISGDLLGTGEKTNVYSRTNLEFYDHNHDFSHNTVFVPLRPVTQEEAIVYKEHELDESEYPKLEIASLFPGIKPILIKNDLLLEEVGFLTLL